jgi:hypothetical protein
MDKEAAAKFLGVSVQTLQRYTGAGRISAKYVHGERGPQAEYEKAEIEKLKESPTSAPAYVRPAVTGAAPGPAAATMTALAPRMQSSNEMLAALIGALKQSVTPAAAVPLLDKLMFTLTESADLSGLSRTYLRQAIGKKKLTVRIIGKGFKVKRSDLEAFNQKL